MSCVDSFINKMISAGLETNDPIIADGTLHRFYVLGDRKGTRNGWYILYTDFPAVGVFGCWKRNIQLKWQPCKDNNLVIADLRTVLERRQGMQSRTARVFQSEFAARHEAAQIWQFAKPASNRHGYLVRKRVRSHGLRYHQGALLIPVLDPDGNFRGMQRIWPNGDKRFSRGTITTGNYYIIGELNDSTLLICEGYSTGATLHEITGTTVIVAFSSSNLRPVSKVIRAAWPNARICMCADDDHNVPANPGLSVATEAATSVNGALLVPRFPGNRGPDDTDFNDLYCISGKAAVLDCLDEIGGRHV